MLAFSSLDEDQYDASANKIIYGKLFENILADFVTREDMKMIMKAANLPVSTTVSTIVNTAVQVVVPAGTGTGVGAGNGSGTGQTSPIYVGDTPSPGSQILKQRRLAEKDAGGVAIEGLTSGLEAVAGE